LGEFDSPGMAFVPEKVVAGQFQELAISRISKPLLVKAQGDRPQARNGFNVAVPCLVLDPNAVSPDDSMRAFFQVPDKICSGMKQDSAVACGDGILLAGRGHFSIRL